MASYAPAWMTPRRSGLLSVLCSTEAFTGLTTRHEWTASQWETWTADALRQLLLQQPLERGSKTRRRQPARHAGPSSPQRQAVNR